MTNEQSYLIVGVLIPAYNKPSFTVPIFKKGIHFFVQNHDENSKEKWIAVEIGKNTFKKINVPYEVRDKSKQIYAFWLNNVNVKTGTKTVIEKYIKSNLKEIKKHPFSLLDVATFIGNNMLEAEALAIATQMLEGIDKRAIDYWRQTYNKHYSIDTMNPYQNETSIKESIELPIKTNIISGRYHLLERQNKIAQIKTLEVCIDVDGYYPLNMLSMIVNINDVDEKKVIVQLNKTSDTVWVGKIIKVVGEDIFNKRIKIITIEKAKKTPTIVIEMTINNSKKIEMILSRSSPYYRDINILYGKTNKNKNNYSYNIHNQPYKSIELVDKTINIKKILKKTGLNVSILDNKSIVTPFNLTKMGVLSRREIHDILQIYWSQIENKNKKTILILEASSFSDSKAVLAMNFKFSNDSKFSGIVVFNDSIMLTCPPDGMGQKKFKKWMLLFSICHNIGHTFNLDHSWERSASPALMKIKDDQKSLSFMNNPHFYDNGMKEFIKKFKFNYDNNELVQIRHASFDNNQLASILPAKRRNSNPFTIEVRINRPTNNIYYMEPVIIECKIKNKSNNIQQKELTKEIIASNLIVGISNNKSTNIKYIQPYYDMQNSSGRHLIESEKSIYTSLFVSADPGGWLIDEPGTYTVSAYFINSKQIIVSNILTLTVMAPKLKKLENLAQDYFCDEVARIYAFNGSTILENGNQVLRRTLQYSLPKNVECQMRYALIAPEQDKAIEELNSQGRNKIITRSKKIGVVDRIINEVDEILINNQMHAIETFGNIEYKKHIDGYTDLLVGQRMIGKAINTQNTLYSNFKQRNVNGKILNEILTNVNNIKMNSL